MRQRALVDIDLLLDTRYGTIKRIDETIADALVASNLYRERHHDNFDLLTNGKIDREVYKALYARRDMETIFHSKMTDFIYHLRMDILKGMDNLERGVLIDEIEIDINVHPYDIDDDSAEVIRRAVAYYIPAPAKVNIVKLSPESLTPAYVDGTYEMLAYNDHEDWLRPNQELLLKKPLPLVTLLTPMIASSGVVPEPTAEIKNPFSCRSAVLVKFIALHYIPTEYSCHNPLVAKEIVAQRMRRQSSSVGK